MKHAIKAGFRGCYELDRAGGNAKNRTMEARSRTEWAFGFNGRGSPTADPSCAVRLKGTSRDATRTWTSGAASAGLATPTSTRHALPSIITEHLSRCSMLVDRACPHKGFQ